MPKTFSDVIQSLIKVNEDMIAGKVSVHIAKQVAINTQVLINSVKAQLAIMKFTQQNASDFFGPAPSTPSIQLAPPIQEASNGPSFAPLTIDYLKKSAALTDKEAQSLFDFCTKKGIYHRNDYTVSIYDEWLDKQLV